MIATNELPRLTPQEYFEWEAQQDLRYEYFDGEVSAMTGGSLPHADIALNVASVLREPLRGRCKVRNSDAKVGITENGPFVYPDVSVTCDNGDRTHPSVGSRVALPSQTDGSKEVLASADRFFPLQTDCRDAIADSINQSPFKIVGVCG